ncbi:hypothetical protein ACNQR9_25700 [Mycolicibacterium peregrinum]
MRLRDILAAVTAVVALGGLGAPAAAAAPANLYCSLSSITGTYYVQVFNATQPPGMCAAAASMYTPDSFRGIAGLTRQCVLDSPTQIAQKHGIVSIYSDSSAGSADAAKAACT